MQIKKTTKYYLTKIIIVIISIIISMPQIIIDQNCKSILYTHAYDVTDTNDNEMVEYNGDITCLGFTTLIAFPDKAFEKNNVEYCDQKITTIEFKNILQQLYINNYILIDIFDLYTIKDKTVTKNKIKIPKNKKPIILTFDNVSYKSSYQNSGEIDKIIIDRNNRLASYTTKKSIQDRVQYDNEFILILENFLTKYPDFHINNARGIIFCTGENGILGYNTCHNYASSKYELKRVTEVINKLKKMGWQFGSNNYKYTYQNEMTTLEFAKDISLWNNEIKPAVKQTPLYAFPYGEYVDNKEKMELLIDSGFTLFFVNNSYDIVNYSDKYDIIKRITIDGYQLKNNPESLSNLFDPSIVFDSANRL